MLHEKPNEFFHWKNKLDELDRLPGELLNDKTVSWNKLHNRLREKPRNNKIMWYWVAAACLVIVFGMQWIIADQSNNSVAGKKPTTPEQSVPLPGIVKEIPVSNFTAPSIKTKQIIPRTPINETFVRITNTVAKDKYIAKDSGILKESVPEIIVKTIDPPDTVAFIAAPVRKKLRIIHINEIDKKTEEQIQFAKLVAPSAFQARMFNQDGSSNLSFGRNASDNILKIKLSPSN